MHIVRHLFILIIIYIYAVNAQAQKAPDISNYHLNIVKTDVAVKVDGLLSESCWQSSEKAKDFYQVFPFDTSYAKSKTEVMVTYDDRFFYVAAICYDEIPGDYVIQSLKRDFSYPISDAFTIVLDPFQDRTNGFAFGVNPMGAQREGLIANGGNFGVTTDWDNIWFSEVKRYTDKWVVEMAIPFKTLRFKESINTWGINFGRNDLKRNESSTWVPVPRIFNIATLNFTGKMHWDNPPKRRGHNISIIPYTIRGVSNTFRNGKLEPTNQKVSRTYNDGVDAKVALSSSLNLDLTINPDFSQVEVDRQQLNLTRFNLFYPEKRLFFLENSDLFAQFGFSQIRPFFSRRIGLYQNPKTLAVTNIPIYAGARLSGRIDEKWRIGIMDVQTGGDTALKINGQNYFVGAVQRQVGSASNLAFICVNRQRAQKYNEEPAYNRLLGVDYNLQSKDNRWKGKFFVHQTFSPLFKGSIQSNANATFLAYSTPKFYFAWNHEYVGKEYRAEMGFIAHQSFRDDSADKTISMTYGRLEPEIGYRLYPKNRKLKKYINNMTFELYNDTYFDSTLIHATDINIRPNIAVAFQSSASFYIEYNNQYTRLLYPSTINGISQKPFSVGEYRYAYVFARCESNRRKKFNYFLNAGYGTFFNGIHQSAGVELSYRIQPYGIVSIATSYDHFKLPAPYNGGKIILIGPKAEIAFTRNLFFTTFVQYNTQINNMNINTRLQWRFRPMSDLFIVYSDNYNTGTDTFRYPQQIVTTSKALVVKLIIWLTR
jgi:hypothetical protein